MHVVTVEFVAKDEYRSEFLTAVKQQAKNSLVSESQCLRFDVCVDEKNPSVVFLYEIYSDREAFAAHLETEHFRSFNETASSWVVSKKLGQWTLQPQDPPPRA